MTIDDLVDEARAAGLSALSEADIEGHANGVVGAAVDRLRGIDDGLADALDGQRAALAELAAAEVREFLRDLAQARRAGAPFVVGSTPAERRAQLRGITDDTRDRIARKRAARESWLGVLEAVGERALPALLALLA